MIRNFFYYAICIILFSSISTTVFSQEKAGIGFGYGIKVMQHSKSSFGEGTANYFRLIFRNNDDSSFYMHNEQASFNVEEGNAQSVGTQNSQMIGTMLGLTDSTYLDIAIGNATLSIPDASGDSGEQVEATKGTGIISEIGLYWVKSPKDRLVLETGLSYRYHRLSKAIKLTNTDAKENYVQIKDSLNLGITISYNF